MFGNYKYFCVIINAMLGLKLPTDPRWVNIAEKSIEEILVDHAYCEQKAASSCISLIVAHPDRTALVDALTPVVTEEWTHFEMVLNELKKRNYHLGTSRPDEYVIQLQKATKKGGSREEQLTEKLLMNALIEARSCERFRLLSENIRDEGLKGFYYRLMKAEANHYMLFVRLAKIYMPETYVNARLQALLEAEAEIMKRLELRGDRMH